VKSSINIIMRPSFLSGIQNHSGLSVFCVSPSGGAISPAAAADITVTFHPDHESLHYRDVLRVKLLNKVRHLHLHINTNYSQDGKWTFLPPMNAKSCTAKIIARQICHLNYIFFFFTLLAIFSGLKQKLCCVLLDWCKKFY